MKNDKDNCGISLIVLIALIGLVVMMAPVIDAQDQAEMVAKIDD